MYDEYGSVVIPPGHGRIRFSRKELLHITVAVAALTFAFFNLFGWWEMQETAMILYFLAVSAIAVVTGFVVHELMHKFMAQRYGAWAEYRLYPLGLMMAVFFSFLGFVFAAPGAVYIQGRITLRQNGIISVAGPASNLVIGTACSFLGLALLGGEGMVGAALVWIGTINLFLALFNLLPIPPLDGSKVWRWNLGIYVALLAASAVMLFYSWGLFGL
jgi:Zn-dependent protease